MPQVASAEPLYLSMRHTQTDSLLFHDGTKISPFLNRQKNAYGSHSSFAGTTSMTSSSSLPISEASMIMRSTSETGNTPRSPAFLDLTLRVLSAISLSPTTAISGTRSCSALRISFAKRSSPFAVSTRNPYLVLASRATFSQNIRASSVTGSSRICWGANQRGNSPAVLSMRTPKKRSTEPKIARWSMIGCCLELSLSTYSNPNRSGRLKSH
mmetsp:Transcript_8871/g.11307  ORF Transcript_8871/g.11307 Transcript_8871/m.11307 type:complete len:212 (-) Transcript_8871:1556-2191(-)